MTPEEYAKAPYARIVIPDENGGFYAEVLEFSGCFAQGRSVDEAFRNLEEAAKSWIEVAAANGQEIPEPSSNLGFAGKVALRLPRSLHRQAVRFAERDGASLNQFLVMAIAGRVGAEDLYSRMVNRLESRLITTAANVIQIAATYLHNYRPQEELLLSGPRLLPEASATAATNQVVTS